jgi:hypothetical protein
MRTAEAIPGLTIGVGTRWRAFRYVNYTGICTTMYFFLQTGSNSSKLVTPRSAASTD